jgi:hypothetical protein
MKTTVTLPVAFSVRDANEFFPLLHVMTRMNASITVTQAATGRHVNGGEAVLWGVVHKAGQPLAKKDVEDALRDAGFDFAQEGSIHASKLWETELGEAAQYRQAQAADPGCATVGRRTSKRKTTENQDPQGVTSKG